MHLIGITGKARAGKDTVAKYLVRNYGFVTSSFARPLKAAAKEMFDLDEDQAFGDDLKETVIPFWGLSPRQMFQKLGTEGGRMVFGDDLWLKRWQRGYERIKDHANVVVSDVRFENEAALIRRLGGYILHVGGRNTGELTSTAQQHASEAGIQRKASDLAIWNDGSFDLLYAKVDETMAWVSLRGGDAA